jgi:hypothetical protein
MIPPWLAVKRHPAIGRGATAPGKYRLASLVNFDRDSLCGSGVRPNAAWLGVYLGLEAIRVTDRHARHRGIISHIRACLGFLPVYFAIEHQRLGAADRTATGRQTVPAAMTLRAMVLR